MIITLSCAKFFSYDQMYEAERWHQNINLQAPMIILPCNSHFFVGQFVTLKICPALIGKVMKFVQLVSAYSHKICAWVNMHNLYIHAWLITCRRAVMKLWQRSFHLRSVAIRPTSFISTHLSFQHLKYYQSYQLILPLITSARQTALSLWMIINVVPFQTRYQLLL